MQEVITIESLDQYGVSIAKTKYENIGGSLIQIGYPWMRAYSNSVIGRELMESEIEEPQKSIILDVWGPNPTVQWSPPEQQPVPVVPTNEELKAENEQMKIDIKLLEDCMIEVITMLYA